MYKTFILAATIAFVSSLAWGANPLMIPGIIQANRMQHLNVPPAPVNSLLPHGPANASSQVLLEGPWRRQAQLHDRLVGRRATLPEAFPGKA